MWLALASTSESSRLPDSHSQHLASSTGSFELVREPIKTLIEPITSGGARSLNVPVTLTQRVKSKFVSELGGVHGIRQILSVRHTAITQSTHGIRQILSVSQWHTTITQSTTSSISRVSIKYDMYCRYLTSTLTWTASQLSLTHDNNAEKLL